MQNRTSWRASQSPALFLQLAALEPGLSLGVKRRERRAVEARQFILDRVADLALQIGEVAITFGKLRQVRFVESQFRIGLDRVDAVFFICEPSQYDAPAAFALFQEIVEAPAADDIAQDALDLCAL